MACRKVKCPDCHGTGRKNNDTCPRCDGEGTITVCDIKGEK